jgi:hypothetical protein
MLTTKITRVTEATASVDDGAFSVDEFCARYNIGKTAFYAEVKAERLAVKKRGRRTLVPRAAARAWFDALPNSQPLSTKDR